MSSLTIGSLNKETVRGFMASHVDSPKWVRLSDDRSYIVLTVGGEERVVSYYTPNRSLALQTVSEAAFLKSIEDTGNALCTSNPTVVENSHGVTKTVFAVWQMYLEYGLEIEVVKAPHFLDNISTAKRTLTVILGNSQHPLARHMKLIASPIPGKDAMAYVVSDDDMWCTVIKGDMEVGVFPYGRNELRSRIKHNACLGNFHPHVDTDKYVGNQVLRLARELNIIK